MLSSNFLKKTCLLNCLLIPISFTTAAQTVDDEWLLMATPFAWGASLKGDAHLAGIKSKVDIPFSEILSDLNSVFMGNLEISRRQWGFYLDAVNVDTRQNASPMGLSAKVGINQNTIAAGAFYRVYERQLSGQNHFGEPRHLAIDPLIGVRWTRLEAQLKVPMLGMDIKKKAHWNDPFIGARLSADLNSRWNLSSQFELGGWDTSDKKTLNSQAYLGYRTHWFRQPTILRGGYRYLHQRYETQDFTGHRFRYDMTQKGPALGVTVRF